MLKRHVGLLFALQFLAMGLFLPYFSIFLADRGLSDAEIGFIIATPLAIRIVSGPVIAAIADRLGRRSLAISIVCVLSGFAAAAFVLASDFAAILMVMISMAIFHAAIIPLSDAYAMDTVRAGRGDYGRMRLWGSLAFMAATLAGGAALEVASSDLVPLSMAGALLTCAAVAFLLPDLNGSGDSRVEMTSARGLRAPRFLVVVAAAALAQGSHAAYYGFGSLFWRGLGIGETMIGAFWMTGVVVEVGLFLVATRLGMRLPPVAMIALGSLAGIVRWTLFPLLSTPSAVIVMQALHGLTFGATHLGLVAFIAANIPARRAATAQGLGGTFIGLFTALGTLASGPLYGYDQAYPFWGMAAACAVSLGLLACVGLVRLRA